MKSVLLSMALVAVAFGGQVEIDVGGHPESVLIHGKKAFVSNVGDELKPTDKDGDGYISLLNQKGEVVDKTFITALNAPKGLALIQNTLYVADVDEVKGFDITTKKQVFSLAFEGVNFLNDIAVKNAHTLIVSATDSGKIYEVNVKTKTYKAIADLPTANGVYYTEGKLYALMLGKTPENMFGGGGKLVEINPRNGTVTPLAKTEGILDGVQKVGNTLYFSDWVKMEKAGVIHTYNLKTKAESDVKLDPIAGPADFWIDVKTNSIWIPEMIEGKVLVTPLP
ncbi:MAG: hypothetical protein WA099_02270 [Sulfuricurvum sp.]